MKIRVIVPVTTQAFAAETAEAYREAARPETEISVVGLDRGPASIESDYEEALAVPDILTKAQVAEKEGMDAVVIDCMADPGVDAARELLTIPVVGPAQASMHLAAMLAHRFSLIGIMERDIPIFHRLFVKFGLEGKVASVRVVNIPVLELEEDPARLTRAVVEASLRAVDEDGAHAIVFGCTGMKGVARTVSEELAGRGYEVPVINPSVVALKLAESLVDLGLAHSKRTYPPPPPKEIIGYDLG
jgi:allantoin racemase